MLPNSPTLCGSHSEEEANEKECFNMPRSLKRAKDFAKIRRAKATKRRFLIQTGVTTKKGEFERRIFPADAAEKGDDDGNMRGETDKRTRK